MGKQDISNFQIVDHALFDIKGAADLYGKQYDAVQTRFRGYSEEIQKLTSYLDENTKGYDSLVVNDDIMEVRMVGEELSPKLVELFPVLKATGLRENFRRHEVDVWFSDSGFKVLTLCKRAGFFDGEQEEGKARWAWETDMMDVATGSFTYLKTGDEIDVCYAYPQDYKAKWNDDSYLLEIDGQFYSKKTDNGDFVIKDSVIEKYLGFGGHVFIPEGVVAVKHGTFSDNISISEITIPSSMKKIPDFSFYKCSGIQKITLSEGVEIIGNCAFSDCNSLVEIVLPQTLRILGNSCFGDCKSLERVELPDSVELIGEFAFSNCCKLQKINLPMSLREIERMAFYNCVKIDFNDFFISSNLISIDFGNTEYWNNMPSIVYNANKTSILYYSQENTDNEFALPETIKQIGNSAFADCANLKSVILPKSLESIGANAFSGCSALTTLAIPDGVAVIGRGAFARCDSLKKLDLPESVSSVGGSAFYKSGLTKLRIPSGVDKIDGNTFEGCKNLTEVTFLDGLVSIEQEAFKDCTKLETIILPASVKDLAKRAFSGCSKLSHVTSAGGLESIGPEVFKGCKKLLKVNLGDSIKTVCEEAFADCVSLSEISLPDGMEKIEQKAFSNTAISQVVIPGSIKEVPASMMLKCSKLKKVIIGLGITKINGKAFSTCPELQEVRIEGELKKKQGAKVFEKSPYVTVYGIPGTKTEEFANENHVRFEPLQV